MNRITVCTESFIAIKMDLTAYQANQLKEVLMVSGLDDNFWSEVTTRLAAEINDLK